MIKNDFRYRIKYKNCMGVLLLIALFLSSFFANRGIAAQVQVCDVGAERLYDKAYKLNKLLKTKYNFDGLEHVGEMTEDSPYDNYCTGLGEYGHAALVTFYTNKAGYVSKITIFSKYGDSIANKNLGIAMGNILISLGLNTHEYNAVTERLFSKGVSDVWVKKTNRRIVLELYSSDDKISVLRITAYDD